MDKPPVFIGSSSEGLHIAEAVFAHLSKETRPKLWTHQLFLPGRYPMETLEQQIRSNSFAIIVASPDDQVIKRGIASPAMRDNLLLEFGMFVGALGRERVFFLCPNISQVTLPSDLLGIIVATYDETRVKSTMDELAAAVQVPCQKMRDMIRQEWKIICRQREATTSRIRASQKGKAIERLHNIIIQLRDAALVVQRDAFAAVSDELAFKKVKNTAMEKIQEITQSFHEDAMLIGVEQEVNTLSNVTSKSLEDLPFPHELSMGKEAIRQKTINTGLGALNTFLGGGDPFQHVQDAASDEANMRISRLKQRYIEWWEHHYPIMEKATIELQDKLFQALMNLASTAHVAEEET